MGKKNTHLPASHKNISPQEPNNKKKYPKIKENNTVILWEEAARRKQQGRDAK
jgi:hypothetical protein